MSAIALPTVEDAGDFIADALRDFPAEIRDPGCDVWIPRVCEAYAVRHGAQVHLPNERDKLTEELGTPFLDAAWNLCRLGVLRPGPTPIRNYSPVDNGGYSVTAFGRGWLLDHERPAYVPTDTNRLTALLVGRQDLFGPVYVTRASDAARCFSAHAYFASCAMIGAAAESILVAAGVAKLGESEALRLYRATAGRKSLTDAVLKGCPEYVAREFRLHADLIGLWRDQSAHAHSTTIGETEAFTNMRGLIRFAQFAEARWKHLATP